MENTGKKGEEGKRRAPVVGCCVCELQSDAGTHLSNSAHLKTLPQGPAAELEKWLSG